MKFCRAFFAFAFCLSIVVTSAAQLPSTTQAPPSTFIQLAQLTASDETEQDGFGGVVAISGDGNTVAVGFQSVGLSGAKDAVYVYTKPSSGWTNMTQVAKLTASEEGISGLGISVALSADGNTIVAGTFDGHNGEYGAAYLYVRPAGGWTDMTETAQLIGSDAYQDMGASVAMSGNTVVVGATGHTNAAYVFVEPASGWANMTQTAKLTSSATNGGKGTGFGGSVAIDGNTIVVGGCGCPQAFLFVEPASGWTDSTETAQLGLQGNVSDAVAVSGNTVVVGVPSGGPVNKLGYPEGAAYVFIEPGAGWTHMGPTATLTASDYGHELGVGSSVAIQNSQILVGASSTSVDDRSYRGAVYQYAMPATGWKTTSHFDSKIVASDLNTGEFGASIALGGDTLTVGAPYAWLSAAYVFGQ